MNILIVEDNTEQAKYLEQMIREIRQEDFVITHYTSGPEALLDIEDGRVSADILFMDIELGNFNGIEIAGQIQKQLPAAQIIFATGYDDYYLEVYEVDHVFLLRKPVDPTLLRKALEKAISRLESRETYFSYDLNKKTCYVPFREITYFEIIRRKIILHTDQGETAGFYETMESLEARLPENFIRCHTSFIINLDKVTSFRAGTVQIGGQEIVISRKYRQAVKKRFAEYLAGRLDPDMDAV